MFTDRTPVGHQQQTLACCVLDQDDTGCLLEEYHIEVPASYIHAPSAVGNSIPIPQWLTAASQFLGTQEAGYFFSILAGFLECF